jgi:predicted metalloprotease
MRWKDERRSDNVEDQRGARPPARLIAGGGIGTVVLLLIGLYLGADPKQLLQVVQQEQQQQQNRAPAGAGGGPAAAGTPDPVEEERKDFVSVVLAETEDVWQELFRKMGATYERPKLVVFTGQVDSACGLTESAVGPFYCPGDQKVYIDLKFYDELKERFRAPGEFAEAYVVAHEVGHHVQNLLGTSRKVSARQRGLDQVEANQLSVRLELQADFYAGVWAYHTQKMRNILEPGDLESALQAATAIGDDNIQRQARGYVVPDAFTHGTSEQRVRWFRKGFTTGDVSQGDTFSADPL